MAERVFLGLGGNVGRRERFLAAALAAVDALPSTRVLRRSRVYETSPVGPRQRDFLNMAAELSTGLSPGALLAALKRLESSLGRRRRRKWGPREIDLDILTFGDRSVRRDALRIPHPRIDERKFVLRPLADLSPRFRPRLRRLTAPDQRITLWRGTLPWKR